MERYYIIRDPSDWPASTMSGTSTTATTTSDDENEDMNSSTITCQFCSRCRGGGMDNNTRKKTKYPAVYYEIEILYGSGGGRGTNNSNSSITNTNTNTTKVYRRYSQFDTLLKQLDPYPYKYQYRNKYNFPPKTYMLDSWRSTDVLDERMLGLYNFLCNILSVVKQQQQECNSNNNNNSGRLIGNFLEF